MNELGARRGSAGEARRGLVGWTVAGVLVASAVAALAGAAPLGVALALGVPVLAVVLMSRPDLATAAVLVVVYTNAAVVAVNVHGLPSFAGRAPVLLLAVPLVHHLVVRRAPVQWSAPSSWCAVFGLMYVAAAAASPTMESTVGAMATFGTEGLGLFVLLTNVIRSPQVLRLCLAAVVGSGAFMGGVCLVQFLTKSYYRDFAGFGQINDTYIAGAANWLLYAGGEAPAGQPRLSGSVGEANFFALVLVTLLPYAVYLVLSAGTRWARAAWSGAAVLILAGVLLTYSRGALVALAVASVVLAVTGLVPRRSLLAVALAGLVAVAAVPDLGSRIAEVRSAVHLGGDGGADLADTAAKGRLSEMTAGLAVFADHPVLGVGPEQFPAYYQAYAGDDTVHAGKGGRQAHSLLVGIAAETGLLGLGAFIGLLLALVQALLRVRRTPAFRAVGTAALAALLLLMSGSLFLHLAYMRYLWMHLALAAAVAIVCRPQAKPAASLRGSAAVPVRLG